MAEGDEELRAKIRKVAWEWLAGSHPPDPDPDQLPRAVPDLSAPDPGRARITWVGHATTLLRLPGLTLLTDPVFAERCSPVPFWGPKRFVPARPRPEELPRVDAVLLSHDHFDHLDRPTVVALNRRFGGELTWYTPLGYREWFEPLGITAVRELDWWEEAPLPGGYRAVCVPARHWTRRRPWETNNRLWCGWVVRPADPAMDTPTDGAQADPAMDTPRGGAEADPAMDTPTDGAEADPAMDPPRDPPAPRIWFAGDSGWCPAFAEIGERLGPFDLSLVPVGAYEPRWFMKASHINPEEAVRAYREAGGRGAFVPIHWGTWRLTFEDPLEPPERTRAAWAEAGLPDEDLHVLRHGETLTVERGG